MSLFDDSDIQLVTKDIPMDDQTKTLRECSPPERIWVTLGMSYQRSSVHGSPSQPSDIKYVRVHPVPADAPDDGLREAARIATWCANSFYPEQEFVLLSTLSGVLSQIDNMMVGVYERSAPTPDAQKEARRIVEAHLGKRHKTGMEAQVDLDALESDIASAIRAAAQSRLTGDSNV